ncbi:MAG TPA: NAD-dependent epimerase [Cyclobacteriaceae bacterium]|nr:NAD-dependent epimerase [Cyclobacteriaceae bacterium]HMV10153.1 NAD-dependent epimerase [Cyclobacteriaceae bacterium]HMV90738.1 NAD-dependent epimerase [Cyclobacteriaceae bacterium]HMX00532.1 NAD-dependent epimerase [Cyclobacteriaceae bacterium]HMX49593.1 NAD-dependent epimerase [Cyclobacteriaceae bacterium]
MAEKHSILITGAAGFIGFHLSRKLCSLGYAVTGIDNLNDYYEVSLKEARLNILKSTEGFTFHKLDITDKKAIDSLFEKSTFKYVVNLAAQAGVRYSLTNPYAYLESNLHGFLNILEACRHNKVEHLIYASSSSVYGANKTMPFSVHHNVDHPISLYAATKKSNELMAHTYSALFNLPTTGLRFFTVYGPYGRPDMALFIFTKAILEGKPIDVYNHGKMKRDFTYVDDIVEGIVRLIPTIPTGDKSWNGATPDAASSFAPYRLYNIGNNSPVELMHFIEVIEDKIGKKAVKNLLPIQEGDVPETYADVDALTEAVGFKPSTSIETGIGNFISWYKEYYKK